MYINQFRYWDRMIYFDDSTFYILDYKQGDVNGDGITDSVYMMGDKPFGMNSSFVSNITLVILDGSTKIYTKIPLKINEGYNPTVFLGDFTGDRVDEMLVSIDSGGSGGFTFNYLYSFLKNEPKLIFDFEEFNEESKFEVKYIDDYRVQISSQKLKKGYTIDISNKEVGYLSEIYGENGKVKGSFKGEVLALSKVYPVDLDNDNILELVIIQRVIGRFNADTLGFIQTYLKWNRMGFTLLNQNAVILGYEL